MKTMQATELRKNIYEVVDEVATSREPVAILKHKRHLAILVPSPDLPPDRRKPLIDLDAIAAFCRRHDVKSFALFGSILRTDFNEESDVDVLVDIGGRDLLFHEECRMLDELEMMFGRKVDMVPKHALSPDLMDEHRLASISSTAKVIYDVAS